MPLTKLKPKPQGDAGWPPTTAQELIDRTKTVAVAPPIAFQIYSLVRGTDYSCEALVDLVSLDPELTAQLLRLCNSIEFRGRQVSSLREAALRLGNGEIAHKAMSLTVGRLAATRKTAYCPDPNALWRHSIQCALACRYLNTHTSGIRWDTDLTFTAGLLHDIGKMVINGLPVTESGKIIAVMEEKDYTGTDAELAVLGADHAEIGGLVLEKWHLPAEIVRATRFHHAPDFDPVGLANLVHVANACTKVTEDTKDWNRFEDEVQPYAMEHLKLTLATVKECWKMVVHDARAIESFMWS